MTSLWSIVAFLSAAIMAMPASAQAQQRCVGRSCARPIVGTARPIVGTSVSTSYRFRTVPRISNVNRYRNVTRTSVRNVTRTSFRNIQRVRFRDITRTHYMRHINRVVTVTRVQPVVRVHMVTQVHHVLLTRVHTRVIPRVHVAVIPRVHTRTVMLTQTQHVAQTRMLPTRFAMGSSRTISMGTRTARIAGGTRMARISGGPLYNYVRPTGKRMRTPRR
jgi:hypothetical protein